MTSPGLRGKRGFFDENSLKLKLDQEFKPVSKEKGKNENYRKY